MGTKIHRLHKFCSLAVYLQYIQFQSSSFYVSCNIMLPPFITSFQLLQWKALFADNIKTHIQQSIDVDILVLSLWQIYQSFKFISELTHQQIFLLCFSIIDQNDYKEKKKVNTPSIQTTTSGNNANLAQCPAQLAS